MNLKQHLKEFSGYTTLHGLHFVFGSGGAVRRLVWFVLVLTGFGFCTKQLIASFLMLQAHEDVISKTVIPSRQLTFPAVTICNINMMKKSLIKGKDAQVYIDNLDVLFKQKKTLNSTFDIQKAVEEYGHTAQDMVIACVWNGKKCSHLNFTTRHSYLYGLCHTFNSGQPGHPLLLATSSKRNRGLSLFITTQIDEYHGKTGYLNSGIRVMIHDQHEEPMIEDDGIDVMNDYKTSIKIQKLEYNSLKYPYQAACGSKKLKTSKFYSQKTYLLECKTNKVVQQCGCRLLGMPNLTESRYCRPEQMMECGIHAEINYSNVVEPNYHDALLDFGYNLPSVTSLDCGCPRPCKEITYSKRVDITNFLSELFIKMIFEFQQNSNDTKQQKSNLMDKNVQQEQYRRNMRENLCLNIHYEDLNTYVTTERPSYDINMFGADVGGYIGLFLGCSVLTVFEFIDFVIVHCFKSRQSSKRFTMNKTTDSREDDRSYDAEKEIGL